ncbi:DUF4118 domain-containing protein [Denitromonas iodatirespirans]|uniref:histidine kinase n=1 Tax=Denitromonas iodatirespirans TaxID=2795389 RepID=A0A944D7R4_DENI1|nr:DUF4118 domain-containing protein [Denitromonas iodatirespirans]MBT0961514.1 DUF4118 domain-containing protein [Denitromonas iodatirespirans]
MGNLRQHHLSPVASQVVAVVACILTATVCLPLRHLLDLTNIAMLLLVTVVLIAVWLGRSPAIVASFVSVALLDFFFVPPHLSFLVSDVQYLVSFAVMLVVSLVISHLTTHLQASVDEARDREHESKALYALAKALAGAMSADEVVARVASFVHQRTWAEARFFLPDAGDTLRGFPEAATRPADVDAAALEQVYRGGGRLPVRHAQAPEASGLLIPLHGATRCEGVLSVGLPGGEAVDGLGPMFEAVASLTAIALERLHLVARAQASQMETEAERLKSSILSSISHDIRTPLTVLFGQADALSLAEGALGAEEREAARAIRDQARRLNQMVEKLLDMARLQSGQVCLRKEWQAIDDVIGASIQMLGDALNEHPVKVLLAPALPLVAMDAVLMERVFCNLLENAAKYSPPGSGIVVQVRNDAGGVVVEVHDGGGGFSPDSLAQVFALFARGNSPSSISGVGLGLAICRSIVAAHGGQIDASNLAEGGACVRFTLPAGGEPPSLEPEPALPAGEGA